MIPNKNSILYKIFIVLAISSLVYSTSYQQFKSFNSSISVGFNDAISYIRMSRNDYAAVPEVHRYRFIIPKMVNIIRDNQIVNNISNLSRSNENKEEKVTKLLFYIINLSFTIATAFIFFTFLENIGLETLGAAIGTVIFITSRVTIFSTSTPLIDSSQFFSITLILNLLYSKNINALSLLAPILVLTKETVFPIIFLPFFNSYFRKFKYLLSTISSIASIIISRNIINNMVIYSNIEKNNVASIFDTLYSHILQVWNNFVYIFTINGFHDLIFSPYGIYLPAAALGYLINKNHNIVRIPNYYLLIIPYSLILALLSGNLGRMFMVSFPVVIPYAALFLICLFDKNLLIKRSS